LIGGYTRFLRGVNFARGRPISYVSVAGKSGHEPYGSDGTNARVRDFEGEWHGVPAQPLSLEILYVAVVPK
jgi:hypothetical protein